MGVLSLFKGNKSGAAVTSDGLLGVVKEYLHAEQLLFTQDHGEDPKVYLNIQYANVALSTYFMSLQDHACLIYYVKVPSVAPEGRRKEVLEFLSRINYGTALGGFIMDVETGDIFYKVAFDVEDGMLSTAMVRNMMTAAASTVDYYYPALVSVMYSHAIPAVAIREAQAQS